MADLRAYEQLDKAGKLFILYTARRMAMRKYQRSPNWVLAMEVFCVGSTYGYRICREAGIDPDAKKIDRGYLRANEER